MSQASRLWLRIFDVDERRQQLHAHTKKNVLKTKKQYMLSIFLYFKPQRYLPSWAVRAAWCHDRVPPPNIASRIRRVARFERHRQARHSQARRTYRQRRQKVDNRCSGQLQRVSPHCRHRRRPSIARRCARPTRSLETRTRRRDPIRIAAHATGGTPLRLRRWSDWRRCRKHAYPFAMLKKCTTLHIFFFEHLSSELCVKQKTLTDLRNVR